MATIRIRDWTKKQLEKIQDEESHSSHDSVIKSLLKDHELAQYAHATAPNAESIESEPAPEEKAFDDLTVFDELTTVDNQVLFLWCPNCGKEMAHLSVENPIDIPVYEMECQRCLTHLDHHAIVGIEIGYPIEKRLVENTLQDDLKACVIDYWDRKLEQLAVEVTDDTDLDHLVWQFGQYARNFNWDWPADVPVIGIEIGTTYRDEMTGDVLEVLECVTENRNELDTYRVKRYDNDAADPETEVMGKESLMPLLLRRSLYVADETEAKNH
ncbi:hypothetical protein [Natrinema halophilum]|uniref:hypothetical protein n=1 Tax=Natrinema halophilum TaxID=1699371 RepID=UPI001F1D8350|nr:hypothetical protein [Natrinema halophilum]UHQ96154.1 hypothetical protein HYG82_22815 [Natrinema halophilum]